MRLAFADPPYPSQAEKLYGCAEVDHKELLLRLDDETVYDGWLLHTSSTALPYVLHLAEELGVGPYRVMAWVKPFAAFKRNVSVAYAWEPVLVKWARKPVVRHRIVMRDWVAQREDTDLPVLERDFIMESITMKKGLTGAKPQQVCWWAFEMLGAEPEDELVDLYPGPLNTVTKAWIAWQEAVRCG